MRDAPGMIRTCDLCLRRAARGLRRVSASRRELAWVAGSGAIDAQSAAWLRARVFARVGTIWARQSRLPAVQRLQEAESQPVPHEIETSQSSESSQGPLVGPFPLGRFRRPR